MRAAFCLMLALVAGAVPAQSADTVTQRDAAAVFAKAEQMIRSTLQLKTSLPPFAASDAGLTRDQVIGRFAQIVSLVTPKFVFNSPRLATFPSLMTFKDAHVRLQADNLAASGFVDRVGPLLTSKEPGMTASEFGDALGYFLCRVAEMTHTPSSKYSPYLMPG